MSPKTTGLLALVALVLGAFVYLYEIEGESARETAVEAEKRIFAGVEAGAIESLELTTSDGIAARFERESGDWRLVSPVAGPGDATALDAIASALAGLARAGSVKAAPGDRDQFGLGSEARLVRFATSGTSHVLRIGRATPVGGNVYVAADEAGDVAYVESYRLNALEHGLTDLRDRRIVRFDAEALAKLVIAWPEAGATTTVELERDADAVWQIRAPIAARADQQTVRELLSNLEYLQATGFVDERTPAIEAALKETALELRSVERLADESAAGSDEGSEQGSGKKGAGRSTSLRIAGLLDGSRIVESGGRLFRLTPERLEDFVRQRDAYRDRQLVELAPGALTQLAFEFAGGESVVLARGEKGWSADGREIDPDAVSSLADQLATLRAEQLVADGMGERELASVGLAPPALRLVLSTADASAAPIAVAFGRLDPERGLFARREDAPIVYALAASLAESLPLDLASFEARYSVPSTPASRPASTPAPATTDPLE